MKIITELLNEEIIWTQEKNDKTRFHASIEGVECLLKMNDFPEEPMYTLFWNQKKIDFDDKPIKWTINYVLSK